MKTTDAIAKEKASVLTGRAPVFPLWHVAVLLGMLAVLVGLSTMHSATGNKVSHKLAGYLVIAAFEWAMVIWIAWGCRIQGVGIYGLLGDFTLRWQLILRDSGLAVGFLVVANVLLGLLRHLVAATPTKELSDLLPHTPMEDAAYLGLTVTAAFCEELIYRGYLQRQFAAHRTRDSKELLSPEEVLQRHRELAARFGHQADRVVAQAREQAHHHAQQPEKTVQQSVTYSRAHVFERAAVQDERAILQAAMDRSMGQATYGQVRHEFEQRVMRGEFRAVEQTDGRAAPQYTTAEMIRMEKDIVGQMQRGNERGYSDPMLVSPQLRMWTEDRHPELSPAQRSAVNDIFLSREKIVGLDGVAGAGKTTTLAVVREGAEAQGYTVEGFAPTSRAAYKLGEAGIETSTLQRHLARGQQPDTGEKRLYVLDESSLASTRQMHEFVERLHPNDRVLLVGDTRQHEAVEAGRPFAQLQEAGMRTVKLEEIVRQRDPELKRAVEQLEHGQVGAAIESLDRQGRVHEVKGHEERIAAIAHEYAKSPESTLVVSPDNRSRTEINQRIHDELQSRGVVSQQKHSINTLVPRQEMTGADRGWAQQYQVNDIVRYSRSSQETGIEKGEYSRVVNVNAHEDTLTVLRTNGEQTSYDPRRQMGVSVYREQEKAFSVGDRIQFTAPSQEMKIANRELGTVEGIAQDGTMRLKLDNERSMSFDPQRHPHLDHGYAVTSYSSQGQTADRVLINIDTELGAKDLLNNRMAYVSVSRGARDAQIFTNNREKLPQALGHDVSHQSAHTPDRKPPQPEIAQTPKQEQSQGMDIGLSL